jgi:uncharacterized protein YozE (UPF0346 family)
VRYEQAKLLIERLKHIAVLYHASHLLPLKLYEALDSYLPDMDEGCRERGCIAVDNFKEKKMTKEDKEYEEISRRYLERARQHTEELQAKWKEAMDKAIAFQEAFQEEFKQDKK